MSWKGLDAESIARLDREQRDLIGRKNRGWIVLCDFPSVAYHEGDPQFWRANLKIDWEENSACEQATGGAKALGIKVSSTHLAELLPEEPRENEKAGRQMRRVLKALKTCYPPDGKVPDDIPTEDVRGHVAEELSADSKNRELAAPSWDTVNRALGRS
jgi:hypothetical protein